MNIGQAAEAAGVNAKMMSMPLVISSNLPK